MINPFLGTVNLFAGNFAPRGWAIASGQILPIAQNTALFALLGTTYGGNGQTTFALPDLRGRAPIHFGQGPGLPNIDIGEVSGTETVSLIASEMPSHNHTMNVSSAKGNTVNPNNNYLAATPAFIQYSSGPANTTTAAITNFSGNGQPHNNMQPYIVMNYCVALEGLFPSRN